jgi:hypothetical protein
MSTSTPTTDAFLSEHADAIRRLGRRVIADITEIGGHLVECKTKVGHGGWLDWLKHEFAWEEQTARNYMNAYEAFGSNPQRVVDLPDLPLRTFYLLAAPSTPEEARVKAIKLAKAGQQITPALAKKIIDNEKEMARIRKSLPEGTTIVSEEMIAEVNQRFANLKDWRKLPPRDPVSAAYHAWQREVERVTEDIEKIANGLPKEVIEYLRSAPEKNTRREAAESLRFRRERATKTLDKALEKIDTLSKKIDWLRGEITDFGRRHTPPAKAPSSPTDPEAESATPGTVH